MAATSILGDCANISLGLEDIHAYPRMAAGDQCHLHIATCSVVSLVEHLNSTFCKLVAWATW